MRSRVLTSIDLVALIGRHGDPHARAIAKRPDLDQRILSLIRALGALEPDVGKVADTAATKTDNADTVRDQLRGMMKSSMSPTKSREVRLRWDGEPGTYAKLRATALTGVPALFQTALADGLGIEVRRAATLTDASDISGLLIALRAVGLAEEQAIMLLTCVRPSALTNLRAINTLAEAYGQIDARDAARVVAEWRGVAPGASETTTANENKAAYRPATSTHLKAS